MPGPVSKALSYNNYITLLIMFKQDDTISGPQTSNDGNESFAALAAQVIAGILSWIFQSGN